MTGVFMPQAVWLMSSGGKDSIAALHALQQSWHWQLAGLVTTFNEANQRIALHGTSLTLLEQQSERFDLPLHGIGLPPECGNAVYEQRIAAGLKSLKLDANVIAFGDLFLEDIRSFRQRQYAAIGWQTHFPLWQLDTMQFSLNTIRSGVRALICCVDLNVLDESFLGREWDEQLLSELPPQVDPAGENGEFHTFVFDAPGMARQVSFELGSDRHISH
ncbi:MAG: ATP-binding protein, partial [Pseudomonadota bacterium]